MMSGLMTTLLKALMGSILIALLLAVAGRPASAHTMNPPQVVTAYDDAGIQTGTSDPLQSNRACTDRVRCCALGECPMVGEVVLASSKIENTPHPVRFAYHPADGATASGIGGPPDVPPPRLRA